MVFLKKSVFRLGGTSTKSTKRRAKTMPALGKPLTASLDAIGKRPQDLVGLLLGYGARAKRSALPKVHVRLSVKGPHGRSAVTINLA